MEYLQNESNKITTVETMNGSLFSEFVQYLDRSERTTKTYLTNLKQFAIWMNKNGITEPSRQDIINYKQDLMQDHKAATVRAYLQAVIAFFKWLSLTGRYANIAEGIHAPAVSTEHKKEALKTNEVKMVENAIEEKAAEKLEKAAQNSKDTQGRTERATEQGQRLKAMYLLTVCLGLRTIELERANVGDLQIIAGQAFLFVQGKGRNEADQKKAVPAEVYAEVKKYLTLRSDRMTAKSPLFVSTGNRSGGNRIAARTISSMLKNALRAAGFDSEVYTAHSLRHSAGTTAMEITQNNIYQVQQYMRHSNPTTTEIYLHVDNTKQDIDISNEIYKRYFAAAAGC